VPIVFQGGFDPVALGVVASLSRPGGNVTGITALGVELAPKRLELLHELTPAATDIALLVNPTNPNVATQSRELQVPPRPLGLRLHVLQATTGRDFEGVIATLAERRIGALVVATDGLFISRSAELAALTVRHAIPAISQFRAFAAAGGLASYGGSITDGY